MQQYDNQKGCKKYCSEKAGQKYQGGIIDQKECEESCNIGNDANDISCARPYGTIDHLHFEIRVVDPETGSTTSIDPTPELVRLLKKQ